MQFYAARWNEVNTKTYQLSLLYDKICEALIMKYEKDFDPTAVNKEAAEDEDEVSPSKKQLLNDWFIEGV